MIVAAVLLMSASADAQVFLLGEDNHRQDIDNIYGFIPENGVEYDQGEYLPTGGGALLLAALGGAYLVGKRRKK